MTATTPNLRPRQLPDPRATGIHTGPARRPTEDIRTPLRAEVVTTDRNATALRRRFHNWLALDVPPDLLDDLVLAVYEAMANVAEHGYASRPDGPGPLRLEAHRGSSHVLVTVADEGSWRAPTGERSRSRGLPLMRLLTHDVHIVAGHRGTVVRLWAEVPPVAAPLGLAVADEDDLSHGRGPPLTAPARAHTPAAGGIGPEALASRLAERMASGEAMDGR